MNWIDVVIIMVLLFTAFLGFRIGMIRTACVAGALILGIVFGSRASVMFARSLGEFIGSRSLGYLLSFTVVFVVAFVGLLLIGNAIYRMVRATPLGWVDSWIGSIMGFLAGVGLVTIGIIYLTGYPISNSDQWLQESFIVSIIKVVITPLFQEFFEEGRRSLTGVACVLKSG